MIQMALIERNQEDGSMTGWTMMGVVKGRWVVVGVVFALGLAAALGGEPQGVGKAKGRARDPQIGMSFRVPYRLTETNHFLVRVRLNGKGPFNFLVDSGAPLLMIGTEAAAKVGLKPPRDQYWTPLDRLDFEGGPRLRDLNARVEDAFQLVGMNALGLPGARIDGILGFTILARFRLEIDLTQDRMTWTRLDYHPPDPPTPDVAKGEGPPPTVKAMNAIGPLAKGFAFLMGKQPEDELRARGFLGVIWSEQEDPGRARLRVKGVLAGSAAQVAGIKVGDGVARINDQAVGSIKDAQAAMAGVLVGDSVTFVVERERASRRLVVIAGKGL